MLLLINLYTDIASVYPRLVTYNISYILGESIFSVRVSSSQQAGFSQSASGVSSNDSTVTMMQRLEILLIPVYIQRY
jgi:hypothetical protein